MPVVDSSVLVALMDRDDPHHPRARRACQAPERWRIPTVATVELAAAIRQGTPGPTARKDTTVRAGLQGLWSLDMVEGAPHHDTDTARKLFLQDRHLSYADAVIIATAWHHGDTLLTFDKRQERAWKKGP